MTLPNEVLIEDVQAEIAGELAGAADPQQLRRLRARLTALRQLRTPASDFAPAGGGWLSDDAATDAPDADEEPEEEARGARGDLGPS